MCTRKKDVEKLSCGFEEKYTKSAVRVVLYMLFSDRTASAVRLDSVRHPIRFRPPPDQIADAIRSDCVRRTMTSAALFPPDTCIRLRKVVTLGAETQTTILLII